MIKSLENYSKYHCHCHRPSFETLQPTLAIFLASDPVLWSHSHQLANYGHLTIPFIPLTFPPKARCSSFAPVSGKIRYNWPNIPLKAMEIHSLKSWFHWPVEDLCHSYLSWSLYSIHLRPVTTYHLKVYIGYCYWIWQLFFPFNIYLFPFLQLVLPKPESHWKHLKKIHNKNQS